MLDAVFAKCFARLSDSQNRRAPSYRSCSFDTVRRSAQAEITSISKSKYASSESVRPSGRGFPPLRLVAVRPCICRKSGRFKRGAAVVILLLRGLRTALFRSFRQLGLIVAANTVRRLPQELVANRKRKDVWRLSALMRRYASHFSIWKILTRWRERMLTPAMDDCRRLSATIACAILEIAKNQLRGRLGAPALDQALAPDQSMTCSRRPIARRCERPNLVLPNPASSRFDLVRRSGDAKMISISNVVKPISSGVRPNGGGPPMLRQALMLIRCPGVGCVMIFTPMEASGQY
jgi:hypothetical protein